MKCTMATIRSAIAHQENAKKRNDPIVRAESKQRPPDAFLKSPPGSLAGSRRIKSKLNLQVRRPKAAERDPSYFGVEGATGVGVIGVAGGVVGVTDTRLSFAACGSLSALASSKLTCHICVVDREVE